MRKSKRRMKTARPQQVSVVKMSSPGVSAGVQALPRMEKPCSPNDLRPLELRERAQQPPTAPNATYLDLECLADMTFEPLEPVWGSVVARGAVTVLAGEPDVGKSFVALNIAAAVTRGELGPRSGLAAEDGRQLILERSNSGRTERHGLVADAKDVAHSPDAQVNPLSTRERLSDSELNTIANSADPRPGPTRERLNYSEPDSIAHPADPRPGQGVLICSPHYERSTTLMRRLRAAKADLSLVQSIHGVRKTEDYGKRGPCWSFQMDRDLAIFEQELMLLQGDENDIGLVVIDPFPFGMSGGGAKQAKVLQELTSRLAEIAYICQVAVLVVCEALPLDDSKRATSMTPYPTVERVAQSAWVVERDPDSSGRRLLLPAKLADEENAPGLAFSWRDGALEWEAESLSMTAQEFRAMALQRAKNPLMLEDASELGRAMDWLQTRLADGPVQSWLIKQDAAENEISLATLRRAFCGLRCESNQVKGSRHHNWGTAGTFHARRMMGAECDDRSRGDDVDRHVKRAEGNSACDLTRWTPGEASKSLTVETSFSAPAVPAQVPASFDDALDGTWNVPATLAVHDEHGFEHQFEHVLHSVNHGVLDDLQVGVHPDQRKLGT